MGRRRWAALLAGLFLLLVAAGCGAGGPAPSPGAHIAVVLRADGSGRVDFWVGGGMRSDTELRELGGRVTAALFRGKALRPTVVRPGTAFVFARTEVRRAYERGRHPVFDVAGRSVGAVLATAGYRDYTLLVRLPRVRSSFGSRVRPPGFEYSWKISAGARPPVGAIVMRPRLLHWAVEMALLGVAVAAVIVAFLGRDVRLAFAGCAAGLVAAVTVLVSDAASGDALGTLGCLGGTSLTVVTRLPLVALPLALLLLVRLMRLRNAPRARSRPE